MELECGEVCRECVGFGNGGCQWDDSPETIHNRGLGWMIMLIAVVPGSALLSGAKVWFVGCPSDFWFGMLIGWSALNIGSLAWMAATRKRVQALTIIKHSTIVVAGVSVAFLGGVACSLTLGPVVAWCGSDFGWGLLIFAGISAALFLLVILIHAIGTRWRDARLAVLQRQNLDQRQADIQNVDQRQADIQSVEVDARNAPAPKHDGTQPQTPAIDETHPETPAIDHP